MPHFHFHALKLFVETDSLKLIILDFYNEKDFNPTDGI
jgi:hypothetical protein